MQLPPSVGSVPAELLTPGVTSRCKLDLLEERGTALWLHCFLRVPPALLAHGLIGM